MSGRNVKSNPKIRGEKDDNKMPKLRRSNYLQSGFGRFNVPVLRFCFSYKELFFSGGSRAKEGGDGDSMECEIYYCTSCAAHLKKLP